MRPLLPSLSLISVMLIGYYYSCKTGECGEVARQSRLVLFCFVLVGMLQRQRADVEGWVNEWYWDA